MSDPGSETSLETAGGGKRFSLLLTVVFFLCFMLLAEGALRLWCPDHTFDGWNNGALRNRVTNAQRALARDGRCDVLLTGSSVGLPLAVDRWREAAGGDVVFYNACVGGQRSDMLSLLFEGVFYPLLQPSRVIFIITPTDVNSGTDARVGESPLLRAPRVRLINKKLNAWTRALAWCDLHSALFRERHYLRTKLSRGTPAEEPNIVYRDDGSRVSPFTITTPAIARKHDPLEKFCFEEKQIDALTELAAFCDGHDVKLTMVSQPLPECAYDQCLTTTESAQARALYDAGLREIERRTGKTITRLNDGQTTFPDALAYDALHANRWGAPALLDDYWQQVVAPMVGDKARVAALPPETGLRFADLCPTPPESVTLRATELPWATEGVLCVGESAVVKLPGEYGAGIWLGEFTANGGKVNAWFGSDNTTATVMSATNENERENGLAFARVELTTTAPLFVRFDKGTRLDAIFLRRMVRP